MDLPPNAEMLAPTNATVGCRRFELTKDAELFSAEANVWTYLYMRLANQHLCPDFGFTCPRKWMLYFQKGLRKSVFACQPAVNASKHHPSSFVIVL